MDTQNQSWFDRRIYRSRHERIVGGVAGGLGAYLGIDTTLVRILFVFLTLVGSGIGLLTYLILWIIVPKAPLDDEPTVDDLPRSAADIPPQPPSWAK